MKNSLNYPTKKTLNIFHANVNGNHFDDLELVISDANLKFNATCTTETSQKENTMFKRNINWFKNCKGWYSNL